MSFLGIDYGEKKVGLALAEDGRLALPLLILNNVSDKVLITELLTVIHRYKIKTIVLGYPLSLAGQATVQTQKVLAFKQRLANFFKSEIILADERFSSKIIKSAQRGLRVRHHDDAAAAAVILQSYLDRLR
ncbi:MAG: Holliday junction resolvase RuvX [Candidatus Buchananbacteria bacterium]